MFGAVLRRCHRPLIYALVAAQLLLSAPVVTSVEKMAQGGTMPCADSMSGETQSPDCPCCPAGVQSLAGCLSACLTTAAIAPTLEFAGAPAGHIEMRGFTAVRVAYLVDPPVKPPPIA